MLIVISPAKTLDFETPAKTKVNTQPALLDRSQVLIDKLQHLAPQDISSLMSISDKLGTLNYDRFQQWQTPFTKDNAKQAVLAFKGDVYTGLDAESFSADDFRFAQKHLRILSGLYGLLRPLDLMQPYRLEMGTKFVFDEYKDLYQFWGSTITQTLNEQLKKTRSDCLINLASNEYFKSVKTTELNADIITPVFKDWKSDKYKIVSFFAKKARGLMSAYIIQKQITEPKQLKKFNVDGYAYDKALSTTTEWVFTRKQ